MGVRRRNRAWLAAGLMMFILSSCGGISMGDRAIVKAVYLNEEEGRIQAALAVFQCGPSADTAAVAEQARIYTGEGETVDEALYCAERAQNKRPFYAQNELLLLGPGTVRKDISPYLRFFEQENAARPNMAVFLTTLSLDAFCACEDRMSQVVGGAQRIADGKTQDAGAYRTITEAAPGSGQAHGWLPVLSFSPLQNGFIGVRSLVLLRDGRADGLLQDEMMQMALVLAGKTRRITLAGELDGEGFTMITQPLRMVKTVGESAQQMSLQLTGAVEELTVGGRASSDEQMRSRLEPLNRYLQELLQDLMADTFGRGNDAFGLSWWMRAQNAAAVEQLAQQGLLYDAGRITVQVSLYALQQ